MFNIKYWEWRLSNPSANQLYKYHLEVIFDELGVAKENINDKNRVELILKNRGCTDKEISKILGEYSSKDINYNYLSSKATLDGEQRKDLFTLNQFQDNTIVTTFEIENANTFNRVKINLPNDLDGFITIIKCTIDGIEMDINKQRKYWKKGAYEIEFPFWTKSENAVIQIEWIAENYFEAFE
jgi:hypothetical protein